MVEPPQFVSGGSSGKFPRLIITTTTVANFLLPPEGARLGKAPHTVSGFLTEAFSSAIPPFTHKSQHFSFPFWSHPFHFLYWLSPGHFHSLLLLLSEYIPPTQPDVPLPENDRLDNIKTIYCHQCQFSLRRQRLLIPLVETETKRIQILPTIPPISGLKTYAYDRRRIPMDKKVVDFQGLFKVKRNLWTPPIRHEKEFLSWKKQSSIIVSTDFKVKRFSTSL